jgi:predicted nucleotide-binding protein
MSDQLGGTNLVSIRDTTENFKVEQISRALRLLAEPILTGLGLSTDQINDKSPPELQLSLATLRSAISKPEGFGLINIRITADAGIILGSTRSDSQIEMTILPILLEREQLVLRRIKLFEDLNRLQNLDDVLNLVEDKSLRTSMQAELKTIREKAAKYDHEIETKRPTVFIGSSSEGLPVAELVQLNLDYSCDCVIWSQGVFGLSEGTLESLVRAADRFDFAVLVLTPDDLVAKRNVTGQQPRDNVLFELGLFMGKLGRERTFIVHGRGLDLKLPTDLAGITPATFARRSDDNMRAALGPVCTQLKTAMGLHGPST